MHALYADELAAVNLEKDEGRKPRMERPGENVRGLWREATAQFQRSQEQSQALLIRSIAHRAEAFAESSSTTFRPVASE